MHPRSIGFLYALALAACGPGMSTSETDADPPASSSSTLEPSTASSTGAPDPTSTGAPTSTSTTSMSTTSTSTTSMSTTSMSTTSTDTSTSTTSTDTTSIDTTTTDTTGTTDGSSSSTTGDPPPDSCEAQKTKEDCLAIDDGGGHDACVWQLQFAQWTEKDGCGDLGGPARCLPVDYVGDGCNFSDCPMFPRLYFRQLGDAVELIDYNGECGLEPDGWGQCQNNPGNDPPACACFC